MHRVLRCTNSPKGVETVNARLKTCSTQKSITESLGIIFESTSNKRVKNWHCPKIDFIKCNKKLHAKF